MPRGRLRSPRLETMESRVLLAVSPAGGDFRVNTHLPQIQVEPSIASDADGDFVVAWESSLQDGSNLGVYAQRFDAAGARRGAEFRVNVTTFRRQSGASVAMDDDGVFVVAWQNHENDFESDIRARVYNAAGTPLTGEILVNQVTGGDQGRASVAMDADGDFVVAWDSRFQDGDGSGIHARRFTAAGAPLGDEFPVNTVTAGWQMFPSVAADGAGGFAVCWQTTPALGAATRLSARRFDPAGEPLGDEFVVADVPDFDPPARLAMNRAGEFAVTWGTLSLPPGGERRGDVYARRYDPGGAPRGEPFLVNSTRTGPQYDPSAALDADGDLVVAWFDEAASDVRARRFDAAGVPEGGDFVVNTFTGTVAAVPSVAAEAGGDFVVAWHGNAPGGSDMDVYARCFRIGTPPAVTGVFLDGSAWRPAFRVALPEGGADAAAFGYAVPAATQLRTLPWAGVDRISVRFSQDVRAERDDLSVRGGDGADYPVTGFEYHAETRTATWTLGRAVRHDEVLLDLDGGAAGVSGAASAGGLPLDGEWNGNGPVRDAFPSGDGAAGGDFLFRINVLPGDVNGDRAVTAADFVQTRARLGIGPLAAARYSVLHDVTGDGVVHAADLLAVRRGMGDSLPAAGPPAAAPPPAFMRARRLNFFAIS